MTYEEFLNQVINNHIEDVKESRNPLPGFMEGGLAGLEACRNKQPEELFEICREASGFLANRTLDREGFAWFTCYEMEIIFVSFSVSAFLLITTGKLCKELPALTTAGLMDAVKIITDWEENKIKKDEAK